MAWWGKVVGGAFGFMLGGPLGALLGASLGHRFDAGLKSHLHSGDQERIQAAFFTATFAVMGHIAKADGRVSQDEIAMAEQLMGQMRLNAEQKKLARSLFNEGRQSDFQLDEITRTVPPGMSPPQHPDQDVYGNPDSGGTGRRLDRPRRKATFSNKSPAHWGLRAVIWNN